MKIFTWMSEHPTGGFNHFVADAYRQINANDINYKNMINAFSTSPTLASDPVKLIQCQKLMGEYNIYVNLISTIAKKGVGTIETLEKS